MSKPRILIVFFLFVTAAQASDRRLVITDYGTVGDGKAVNTKSIQAAIDQLGISGGGVLVVPKGTFLSGALFFRQGVDLLVEDGGILKGTVNQADYPLVHTRWEGVEGMHTSAFLNFDSMSNVSVTGRGTIDGSGDLWMRSGRGRFSRRFSTTRPTTRRFAQTRPAFVFQQIGRPRLICFSNCTNVHISDLHLQKQAVWCLHILYSQNVTVQNLNIRATQYIPSSDGIDVDSSRDVEISHCDIACYDDDIAIKSGKDDDGRRVNRPTENVTIEDCTIGVGAGIAIGSEVTGSIRHVLVERCTFNGTDAAARFKSQPSRGGEITDVVYRDIQLNNVGRAVEMLMDWDMRLERMAPAATLTDLHDVRLIHFTGTARNVGVIHGIAGGLIHDVTFEDCSIASPRGLVVDNAKNIDRAGLTVH
jgi:exo-poly-alpha-galacturonosidase